MKKQHSRKKALVSSLIMLLVAMIALGSATYAWFTNSTVATADGISVKTSAAEGLLVKTADASVFASTSSWTSFTDVTLAPSSVAMTGTGAGTKNWYRADANSSGAAIKTELLGTTASIGAGYAIKTSVSVKTVDETESTNDLELNISIVNCTVSDYIRIAIVDDTGAVKAVWANASGTTAAVSGAYDTTAEPAETAITTNYTTTNAAINLGKLTTETYQVYIWLEGQDADCTNPTATPVAGAITFNFNI